MAENAATAKTFASRSRPSGGTFLSALAGLVIARAGIGRLWQHRYGAYDPSPVVSSRICLASSTNAPGTSTSLGPAARKSGASKPGARRISDGIPASFSTPSISSATDSSGAAATFTQLSAMHVSYPRLFTEVTHGPCRATPKP